MQPARAALIPGPVFWTVAVALLAAAAISAPPHVPWAFDWPKAWGVPAARWITDATKWLVNEASFGLFTFKEATRAIAATVELPYRLAEALLVKGFAGAVPVPPLPWSVVIVLAALLGWHAGGGRVALGAGGCFLFVAAFGQWEAAMVTLASILVAVPVGVLAGAILGIAAWRWPWLDLALRPFLDLMQTIPVFAYLVPVLYLFGFGPTAAVLATLIYAVPPMTRVTTLALNRVPPELRELARMTGCSRIQELRRVMLPTAREAMMLGVNQVVMLSLNMVIIASMIGAGGLGFDVLAALRKLDIGAGVEAGLAIVALAVALDRISQAYAAPDRVRRPFWPVLGVLVAGYALAFAVPETRAYPDGLRLSTGAAFNRAVEWINLTYFDRLEAVKDALLLNLLIPVKRAMLALPWAGVALLLAAAGWRLSGIGLALLGAMVPVAIAAVGLWEPAMVTVYLCGLSVIAAMAIGLPLGILAAEHPALWPPLRGLLDTAQVLPSFVWLMPAVMLFRVGDFTAMLAVVAFAVVPAVRYTVLGLRAVDPALVEAGRAMGATGWQRLTRIKLRLAVPEILLGLNQTIMFALSMLVITALVGTRDLGQEVYIALTKADPGRGLVAGLAIALIAILVDRLIHAAAARARARLGLETAR